MRVVGGEQEELRLRLLDELAHRLRGNGMNFTWRRMYSDALSGSFSAGSVRWKVACAKAHEPRHHPQDALLDAAAAQAGEALEEAVQGYAGQERLRRVVQHQVVLGADVLAAAQEVRRRGARILPLAHAEMTQRGSGRRTLRSSDVG